MTTSDAILTRLFLAIGIVSRHLTRRGRMRLGTFIGVVFRSISARRRSITLDNIAKAFPNASATEVDRIYRGAYQNMGIVFAELVALPGVSREELTDQVTIHGIHEPVDCLNNGRPVVMISAHYGNWEYLALVGGLLFPTPMSVVVHPQRNSPANDILDSYRSKYGNLLLPMRAAARPLVKVMEGGGVAAFLLDQNGHPEKDPWINFMGRPTPTYEAPAALALKYNAAVFCLFADRLPDGRYEATIQQLPTDDLDYTKEGIVELTRRHVAALETVVRRRPELWSWQHRRWRYQPPAGKDMSA